MQALLFPLGSTGDVLPFVGLGRVLRARGHAVTVAANPHFAPLVARAGLGFVALGNEEDYATLCGNPRFMDRARGFRFVMDWASRLVAPTIELCAAHRSSLVVAHPLAFGARLADERLGLRAATLVLSPAILAAVDGWLKRFVFYRLVAPPVRRALERERAAAHLSLAMYPAWFAGVARGGPRQVGFPLYDDPYDAARLALPSLDGRPIFFTAGTGHRHARAFFAAAVEASARLGRRALLLTQHPEQLPPSLPPGVEHASYLPLSRVLPCAAALVHHGGIGSAAAALAAGVPQLVIPFAHDQPDNAARLCRLGVAAALWPLRASGARMAARLRQLLSSPSVAARCHTLAAAVRPGLDDACDLLESYAFADQAPAVGAA
jgi:rhamnosyltransferase subunit B